MSVVIIKSREALDEDATLDLPADHGADAFAFV